MKFIWVLFALFLLPTSSFAQSQRNPCFNVGTTENQQNCNPVGITAGLPVQIAAPQSTIVVTNCGGSITTGGTAQPLFTAAQYQHGFIVEVGANDSNTDAIYFSDGSTTATPGAGVAGSWSLAPSTATAPGGSFTSPPNFPVNAAYFINGATTADKYKCRVW